MKLSIRITPAVLFIAMSVPLGFAQAPWKQIPVPPLQAFHPQEPKRIALPNGMVIFLQEDHELPLIEGTARIRGGSREEPAAKVGLLDVYGETWRTGGTKTQTGDQLDDYLEIRAAKVETNNNADSTTIGLSCLKDDFDDVFKVFIELLREPEFRADKVDLAQKENFDGISRRNDDSDGIAGREAAKLAYGADSPYTRQAEYATIAAVTRQDLVDWHHKYVYPNNMILGIVGDFDSAAMEAKLRKAFSTWPKGPAWQEPKLEFKPAKPGYYLIPKDDVNQSNIHMVALGTRRDNPDYYAIEVFNEAFGGGFSSRLFRNIRTAQGLAYSVGGGVGTRFDHPGMVQLVMATKSGTTIESVQSLFVQIDDLAKNPISQDEIKSAKDGILNSFVFNFDSPEKVLRERMAYEFYGYPANFLENYRAGIEKIGPADVARAASKYLHKDQLAVLIVGNTSEFDKPLTSLGPVTNVDISIPPPPAEKLDAPADKPVGSNAEGKALAAKVVEAMGGVEKLKAVRAMRVTFTEGDGGGAATPVVVTAQFPDRMHIDVKTPQGTLSIVVTPDIGFMSAEGKGSRSLPPEQKADNMTQLHHDPIYLAQHIDDPAFTFQAGGTEKIGDVETTIVDIGGAIPSIRWYVDPKSGHVLRESYKALGDSGPVNGETDLSDWKTADGITLPYLHKNKENGKDSSVVTYQTIELDPTVDPKLFEKPAAVAKPAQ